MDAMARTPAPAELDRIMDAEWVAEGHQDLLPSETFRLHSDHVGDTIEITIVLPQAAEPGELLSTVYVLDPSFNLKPAAAAADMLGTFATLTGAPFPPLAVVGVGYPAHDPMSVMGLRARDLTPTENGFPAEIGASPVPFGFGGAERFLAAIVDEVIPKTEERFPVRQRVRTLLGHSFGGLFGLYTLFHRPEVFGNYLIVSPSLWWGDRIVLSYEEQWAKEHADLQANVFLAVGDNEQVVGETWRNESFSTEALKLLRQVDNVQELTDRLRGRDYPSISVESVIFEGEYHLTLLPAAVTRGLLVLFDKSVS
jgi:predicted alpha/beta superfamily hydrolase